MAIPGDRPELNVVAPLPQAPQPSPPTGHAPQGNDPGTISLSFYLEAISQGRWIVLGAVVTVAILATGVVLVLRATGAL